jgi:lysozyme family protein
VTPFETAFNRVVAAEGGYSNIAADRGGRTMLGITERTALLNGYTGDIAKLTIDDARRIYKSAYWDSMKLDEIAALSQPIAFELFDTGVNCGVGVSRSFLQRCLNALNRQGD